MFSSCVTVLLKQLHSWNIKSPIPKHVPGLPGWLQLLTDRTFLRWKWGLQVRSTLIHSHISSVFFTNEQLYNSYILSRCMKNGNGDVAFMCHNVIPGEWCLLPKSKILLTVTKLLRQEVMIPRLLIFFSESEFLSKWEAWLQAVVQGRQ